MYQDKRDRLDMSIARRACQSKTLCGRSVPDWQPSCERLPPAGWAVVALGVGMMALCCAVVSCVEFSCSGPTINSAGVFCRPEIIRQYIGNRHNSLNTADTGCFYYLCQAILKGLWRAICTTHSIAPTGGPLLYK